MMTVDKKTKESVTSYVENKNWINSTTEVKTDEDHEPVSQINAVKETSEIEMTTQTDSERTPRTHELPNKDDLPIDKGWAWVVLAGVIFFLILFGGIKKNYGLFFVAIQDKFGSTASVTSLLSTSQRLIISFTSLIVMTVGMQFMTKRMAVIFGALLYTLANIISAFATNIQMLFATIGFIEGIARALIYPPLTVSLLEYFHKKRGLANGLALSGASLGSLIFAPVFAKLFEELGYFGTFMIVAGITLSFLVSGAVIKPLNSFGTETKENVQMNTKTKTDNDADRGSINASQEISLEGFQEVVEN